MSDKSGKDEGVIEESSQPRAQQPLSPPPTPPSSISFIESVAFVSSGEFHNALPGTEHPVASCEKVPPALVTLTGDCSDHAVGQPREADAIVDANKRDAMETFSSLHNHLVSPDLPRGQCSPAACPTFSPPQRSTVLGLAVALASTQSSTQDVACSAQLSAEGISQLKEGREYQRLKRDMQRILSAIEGTHLSDWAMQASLLSELRVCLQRYKNLISTVELPDGLQFFKAISRTLSSLSVVGVQRKALEALQSYFDYANPEYPMTKDLSFVLPGLLELLPQASMQVKGDILELLDSRVVRRLPGCSLRACVQGLLTGLLSCLEESETSCMYLQAMSLLEYVQETLARDSKMPSSTSNHHDQLIELRGGQVLPAHTWVLIRDASVLRPPALNLMRVLMAQGGGLSSGASPSLAEGTEVGVAGTTTHTSPALSLLPDWVGGDAATMTSALLNCLQDTEEKIHRLVLDLLPTICPLTSVDGGCACAAHPPPGAFSVDDAGQSPDDLPKEALSVRCCGDSVISCEVKFLLVAAAVQLLGTQYGTPSVVRRILQWLTVDPRLTGVAEAGRDVGEASLSDVCSGEYRSEAMDPPAPGSCVTYVRNVASFLISQGFNMIVERWATRQDGGVDERASGHPVTPYASAALSSLEHTATMAVRSAAAPRLASASSVTAAFGCCEMNSDCIAFSGVPACVAGALVWARALLVLFRYQSCISRESSSVQRQTSVRWDSPAEEVADMPGEMYCAPFLMHAGPLLLPSLCRLIALVSTALGDASGSVSVGTATNLWELELHELLRVLPWDSLVDVDTCAVQAVERLLQDLLHPGRLGVKESDGNTTPDALSRPVHLQAINAHRTWRRISVRLSDLHATAQALESLLVDATAGQPLSAQGYVLASLRWSEKVAQLLSGVLTSLEVLLRSYGAVDRAATPSDATLVCKGSQVELLVLTADSLLRLLLHRIQQLVEPILDRIISTVGATGTPSGETAVFYQSFLSALEVGVLLRIRNTISSLTAFAFHRPQTEACDDGSGRVDGVEAASLLAIFSFPEHAPDLQRLLARMHRAILRLTAFLVLSHLRSLPQKEAPRNLLREESSFEHGIGWRDCDLAKQTIAWLGSLAASATVAASVGAHVFWFRAVRLLLDVMLRARGCLLPEEVYSVLEPACCTAGGVAESVAFTDAYLLSPLIHCLWEGCTGYGEASKASLRTVSCNTSVDAAATDQFAGTVDLCRVSLLALIAVSPACSRCLDTFLLETPTDIAVPRLVGLHRELAGLRIKESCGFCPSVSFPMLATFVDEDLGILFLGYLLILDSLLCAVGDTPAHRSSIAESAHQLARSYLSHAILRDLPGILLPLHFSFLSPLVTASACNGLNRCDLGRDEVGVVPSVAATVGASFTAHNKGTPAVSTVSLTVLLPSLASRWSTALAGSTVQMRSKWFQETDRGAVAYGYRGTSTHGYRCIEGAELMRYFFALLQLPTAGDWVRLSMDTPTPNSLRVLLRAFEAQASVPVDGMQSSSAMTPAREGPTATLFSATAVLLLSLARHALVSLHTARTHRKFLHHNRQFRGCTCASRSSTLPMTPEDMTATRQEHCSTLLDAISCLNRLLEVSQSGPRMRPHPAAATLWRFTGAQVLLFTQLAVQADLHAAQVLLLDHIRGVALYLDDVGGLLPSRELPRHTSGVMSSVVASPHWLPHEFLHPDVAVSKVASCPTKPAAQKCRASLLHAGAAHAVGPTEAGAFASDRYSILSETSVLEVLRHAPPSVLSNRLLYALIGEVAESVLCRHDTAAGPDGEGDAVGVLLNSQRIKEDTLALWLRFYIDMMPYLYRDLVSSSERVINVLLSVLEARSGSCVGSRAALSVCSPVTGFSAQSVCFATLLDIARYVCSVARVADAEHYQVALQKKGSMSWIASTFIREDPVAQAQVATLWERSLVLSPLRDTLSRLVAVASRCMRACDVAAHQPVTGGQSALSSMWAHDIAVDEMVIGGAVNAAAAENQVLAGPEQELRNQARDLLCLLNRAAGKQFLRTFMLNWCEQYAQQSSWWLFEDTQQRQRRLLVTAIYSEGKCRVPGSIISQECDGDRVRAAKGEEEEGQTTACRLKHEAQKAACMLLVDLDVSIAEVAELVASLVQASLRGKSDVHTGPLGETPAVTPIGGSDAAASQSRSFAPSPPLATRLLFFLDQVVEGHCAERPGLFSHTDAKGVLAALVDVVSKSTPDVLACCCLFHVLYCIVAYAVDEDTEGRAGIRAGHTRIGGRGGRGLRHSGQSIAAVGSRITVFNVYRIHSFSLALCSLLEGFHIEFDDAHRSSAVLSLELLCRMLHSVLPSSLGAIDNTGRVVDAATHLFLRVLLPVLRRGIAFASEGDIVHWAPLVCASLRVLRTLVIGFSPNFTFERRVQRDTLSLVFSEHFFRYTRCALHEWALLLREWGSVDQGFHRLLCERLVPSRGRLSAMMMSRETEALLWERSLQTLGFYTYAMHINVPLGAVRAAETTGVTAATSAAGSILALSQHTEFVHLLRERLTRAFEKFSSSSSPTVDQLHRKDLFLQPVRAALFVFRVVLLCNVRESLTASLWPVVVPELLRVLSIRLTGNDSHGCDRSRSPSPSSLERSVVLREIAATQMEALKVLDTDYTLFPAHALAFRWLFTEDTTLTSLAMLQRREVAPQSNDSSFAHDATRHPAVSHLEVLHLLQTSSPSAVEHLDAAALMNTVHERRAPTVEPPHASSLAAPLSLICRTCPKSRRASPLNTGLRRPLYNIPSTHYARLDGVYRAAQAFTSLLQRLNTNTWRTSPVQQSQVGNAAMLASLCHVVSATVGMHNEADITYMYDLIEADMTNTDPDTVE